MADRWSSNQNIKFVELYKDQTNLWNCLDPHYKNRDLRKASLEHIRNELGLQDLNEVTKKIKNLRSTYNQELLKIEKSKRSGGSSDQIYKPSVKWFDSMHYIMKIINLREKETTSNLEPHHTSTSTSVNELSEESSEANNEETNPSSNNDHIDANQRMKPPKRPRSTIKLTPERSDIQAAVNELKELNNSLTMSAPDPRQSEDECDIIGRHVTLQLRQLPLIDRIDATDEIHSILSRYRKKTLYARAVYTPSYSSESVPSSQPTVAFPIQERLHFTPTPTTSEYYQTGPSAHSTQLEQSSQSILSNDIITEAITFSNAV